MKRTSNMSEHKKWKKTGPKKGGKKERSGTNNGMHCSRQEKEIEERQYVYSCNEFKELSSVLIFHSLCVSLAKFVVYLSHE